MNGLFQFLQDTYWPQKTYRDEFDRQMGQAEGLLGQETQMIEPNGPGLPGDPAAGIYPGSGLMGGQTTPAQYGAGMSNIPMFKTQGASIMNQESRNKAMMEMQQQEQDFYSKNMNAYQRKQTALQERDNLMGRIDKLTTQYDQETSQYEPSIRAAGNVDNLLKSYEGNYSKMTGIDLQAIQSNFLSTIRPGEAQMEGDIKNLAKSMGFQGQLKDFFTWLTDNKAKQPEHIKLMHEMIQKQATLDQERIDSTRRKLGDSYGIDEGNMKKITWRGIDTYVRPTSMTREDPTKTTVTAPDVTADGWE